MITPRSAHAFVVLGAALAAGTSARLDLEKDSPAVRDGRLAQDIGIETLGGVFTPLLVRGQSVPCEKTETFSTAADNQDNVEIRLFRGTAKMARENSRVGHFAIHHIPKRPRGTLNIEVTFSVTADGTIGVAARERTGHRVSLRLLSGD